jgi:hypothetical protein
MCIRRWMRASPAPRRTLSDVRLVPTAGGSFVAVDMAEPLPLVPGKGEREGPRATPNENKDRAKKA